MGLFDIFKNKKDNLTEEIDEYNTGQDEKKSSDSKNDEEKYALETYRQLKAETKVPCVKMELNDDKPSIFESKVGGLGYIPHDEKFPADSKGRQLRLLAQIDCSKVSIEEFPKAGLLQFWILNNDLCGADFDNNTKQDSFRIIYYNDIDTSVTENEIKAKFEENEFDNDKMFPVSGEYGLIFNTDEDSLSVCDCHFETKFVEKYNQLNTNNKIKSYYDITTDIDDIDGDTNGFGHKIGGYPAFTQEDPREEDTSYDFLMLQLDSEFGDGKDRILWGDAGICNFFINSEKLKNLDFSDVIYNWDCY